MAKKNKKLVKEETKNNDVDQNIMVRKSVRTEEQKKIIHTRLNRIAGQVNGINKMIEDDKYADDIIIQLLAINNSVKSLGNMITEMHMYGDVVEQIKQGNVEALNDVSVLYKRFQ